MTSQPDAAVANTVGRGRAASDSMASTFEMSAAEAGADIGSRLLRPLAAFASAYCGAAPASTHKISFAPSVDGDAAQPEMRGASSQARGRRADIACGESSCQMAAAAAAAASAACDDSGSSLRSGLFCGAEASPFGQIRLHFTTRANSMKRADGKRVCGRSPESYPRGRGAARKSCRIRRPDEVQQEAARRVWLSCC